MKQPSDLESRILGAMLIELRKAMKQRAQLTIIIDPFVSGGGAHIGCYPNHTGCTYEIEATSTKKKRPAK